MTPIDVNTRGTPNRASLLSRGNRDRVEVLEMVVVCTAVVAVRGLELDRLSRDTGIPPGLHDRDCGKGPPCEKEELGERVSTPLPHTNPTSLPHMCPTCAPFFVRCALLRRTRSMQSQHPCIAL